MRYAPQPITACHPALPGGAPEIFSAEGSSAFLHAEMFNQLHGIAPQMLVARIGFSYSWTNCTAVEYPWNFYGQKRKTYLAWRQSLLGPLPWSKK
jgi:hypothetical protein